MRPGVIGKKWFDGFVPLDLEKSNDSINAVAWTEPLLREDKTLSKGNNEALHRAHEASHDICCTGRA